MKKHYMLDIDSELFKLQRKAIGAMIAEGTMPDADTLSGIQELLDALADQAHDIHGMDTLNSDEPAEGIEREIAIVWSVTEVKSVRADLTDAQAAKVLARLRDKHDSNIGITWENVEAVSDELFPES